MFQTRWRIFYSHYIIKFTFILLHNEFYVPKFYGVIVEGSDGNSLNDLPINYQQDTRRF